MTGSDVPPSFRLAYVPGVIPAKWVRIWQERMPDVPLTLTGVPAAEAAAEVREGRADAVFGRLPLDRAELSVIPLYVETTVVVVPKDHLVAAVDEVAVADLADELLLHPCDDTLPWDRPPGRPANERPATTGDAVELVAAGVGLLVVPQSLARLHHRRDLTYRPVTDAPTSQVGLCWREDQTTDLMETFIGIVRGRTVNSSRGRPTPAREKTKEKTKEKAKEKPKARRPAAAAGRSGGGAGGGRSRRGSGGPKPAKRRKPRR